VVNGAIYLIASYSLTMSTAGVRFRRLPLSMWQFSPLSKRRLSRTFKITIFLWTDHRVM